jgi:ribulose-5-phosphate 4-epimerase/fuculose-1-phosphate aldolase
VYGSAGDLRDQLAWAGRTVVGAGLVVGSGGNLSARIPGRESCWVTGAGTWLDALRREDFVRVRIGAVSGDSPGTAPGTGAAVPAAGAATTGPAGPAPTSELPLHLATYLARPDVNAVVHLHPQTAVLLDALNVTIRLITTDHAYYLRRVARTPFRRPGTAALAEVAAEAAVDANCVLLAHHGCSVLADTVELAVKRALYLEEAARLTYRAVALSNGHAVPECPEEFLQHIDAYQHG